MLLFAQQITPRLQYIAAFSGKQIIGEDIYVTNNQQEFMNYVGAKINYSHKKISEKEIWLQPHSLLFETGVKVQEINCLDVKGHKAFFQANGDFPFDIFAATFYLLSRYEEYLPHEKDEYGRFSHKNAIAFKEGFLNKPVVNNWLHYFSETLVQKFPALAIHQSAFTFLPTYDIDEAFAYKHKQWWRSVGSGIKNWLSGNKGELALRRSVLNGTVSDPYDTYKWMSNLHEKYNLHPVYFFLVAQRNKGYDKNILPAEPAMQQVIKEQAAKYTTGLHPSWQSGDNTTLIKKEKEILERITDKPVFISRQHYIRFTMPNTFRQLINAGITTDHSMGYGSINGFRASVASPFYWYDLDKETQTSLLLYPFCFMDANSFYEQKQTAEQTAQELRHYYEVVKKTNGTLITLWHNNFFGSDERFKGWKEVYEEFLKKALNK
jgi:hypothetical protein